ncbi:FAD-binding oxidoreductase [Rhodovulum tesquicola]|uniref:FAD-binding oxidoreductase n=1 Tax=Rhodovulum tesquicola TaxID=540254 RepID=UPI0020974CCE|nr:FAD-binding oxidoreductase [Rhodovulum tesquicola]MCO8146769.1 FAD-binding oxidoreductase [Rhodovulum tesquicola]
MQTDTLKRRLRGNLITRFDPGHAEACDALVWNGRKPARRTRLIVRAACADDVAEAVRFAARNGLTVSPRGGGHHFTGIAAQADIVVDLGALDGLRIDPKRRVARVEPGVPNARMAAALARHDLAFPLGHCGSVPMSGYLLGGGIGWNSGAWGVACFLVEAIEVVMADGRLLTASETENAEVFWAARGAGPAFFGIVTAYHLRLMEAPKAILTELRVYPLALAGTVATWAEAAMADAPANVELTLKIATPPPEMPVQGPMVEAIATVFAEGDTAGHATLAELFARAPEAMQVIGPMPTPFDVLYGFTARSMPEGLRYGVDSLWSDARFPEIVERIATGMVSAPSPRSLALMMLRSPRALPPGDGAFSRIGRIFGSVYAIWEDADEDAAQLRWLRATMAGTAPLCLGAYVGEADLENGPRRLPTHDPAADARLRDLAARFDPAGLFTTPAADCAAA